MPIPQGYRNIDQAELDRLREMRKKIFDILNETYTEADDKCDKIYELVS